MWVCRDARHCCFSKSKHPLWGSPLASPSQFVLPLHTLVFPSRRFFFEKRIFTWQRGWNKKWRNLGGPFVSSPVSYRAHPVPMAWLSSHINGLKEACLSFLNLVGCHEMGLQNSSWKSPCMVAKRIGTDQPSPVEISYWLTVIYCLSIVFGKCPQVKFMVLVNFTLPAFQDLLRFFKTSLILSLSQSEFYNRSLVTHPPSIRQGMFSPCLYPLYSPRLLALLRNPGAYNLWLPGCQWASSRWPWRVGGARWNTACSPCKSYGAQKVKPGSGPYSLHISFIFIPELHS